MLTPATVKADLGISDRVKTKLTAFLPILFCALLTLTGCQTTTSQVYEYHASMVNLNGNGQTETNINERVYGGMYYGKTQETFMLGSTNQWLICFYPPSDPLNETNQWDTDSRQAYVWLVRTPISIASDDRNFAPLFKHPGTAPFPNSEALHGTIETATFDGRHRNRRYFAADLSGDDDVLVTLKMNTYLKSKTKFEPALIWIAPAMMFGLVHE
jgi:hypothetical protein